MHCFREALILAKEMTVEYFYVRTVHGYIGLPYYRRGVRGEGTDAIPFPVLSIHRLFIQRCLIR